MTDRTPAHVPPGAGHDERARRGFDLVQADPAGAHRLLAAVVKARAATPTARVTALWGLGRLAHDRGAIDEALTVYTDAVALASDTGFPEIAAEIRVSWSVCLQAGGDADEALAQLELAEPVLVGGPLGRLHMQRGFLQWTAGDRAAAVESYDMGLPLLREAGDDLAATRLISNRGVTLLQLGDVARARVDFDESQEMARRLGQHVLAAGALHNLAYLDGRLGQFPAALRGFADARDQYASVGSPGRYVGDLDIDECGVLIEAGLAAEAEQMAARVVDAAQASGNSVQVAEAMVLLARSRLMSGDAAGTEEIATQAAALFHAARRTAWAALARYWATVAADRNAGRRTTALRQFVRLRSVADELERHGWASEAVEIRVLTGRRALDAGRRDVADEVLRAAASARRHPLARVRADAWHAAALLAHADGDATGARRALRAGLRSIEEYRASVGATEMRSHAGQFGEPLAQLGLRLAIERGESRGVLRWAEQSRAVALGNTAGPAAGVDVELDALREARLELADAQGSGRLTGAGLAELAERVGDLEAAVASRARHRAGSAAESRRMLAPADVRAVLGGRSLVEFVEVDGELHAVTVTGRGARLTRIASTAQIAAANDHLVFAVRRLSYGGPAEAVARLTMAMDRAAADLDAVLFGPMHRLLGPGEVVVVPTGALHSILWSALPTARRSGGLSLAPSATWWLDAGAQNARNDRAAAVLLVAGPDLACAAAEIDALRRLYPGATALTGRDATVAAVCAAMSTSTLVHVAAHGHFRRDNPLFSSLQLHDGLLSVHHLETLPSLPSTVVLTACSSGRSGVLPGDELLGTSASLMSLGVRSLAAPLLPVADAATVAVAVGIHEGLRRHGRLAAALADVVGVARDTGRADLLAAASSFNCFAASA